MCALGVTCSSVPGRPHAAIGQEGCTPGGWWQPGPGAPLLPCRTTMRCWAEPRRTMGCTKMQSPCWQASIKVDAMDVESGAVLAGKAKRDGCYRQKLLCGLLTAGNPLWRLALAHAQAHYQQQLPSL